MIDKKYLFNLTSLKGLYLFLYFLLNIPEVSVKLVVHYKEGDFMSILN